MVESHAKFEQGLEWLRSIDWLLELHFNFMRCILCIVKLQLANQTHQSYVIRRSKNANTLEVKLQTHIYRPFAQGKLSVSQQTKWLIEIF